MMTKADELERHDTATTVHYGYAMSVSMMKDVLPLLISSNSFLKTTETGARAVERLNEGEEDSLQRKT